MPCCAWTRWRRCTTSCSCSCTTSRPRCCSARSCCWRLSCRVYGGKWQVGMLVFILYSYMQLKLHLRAIAIAAYTHWIPQTQLPQFFLCCHSRTSGWGSVLRCLWEPWRYEGRWGPTNPTVPPQRWRAQHPAAEDQAAWSPQGPHHCQESLPQKQEGSSPRHTDIWGVLYSFVLYSSTLFMCLFYRKSVLSTTIRRCSREKEAMMAAVLWR